MFVCCTEVKFSCGVIKKKPGLFASACKDNLCSTEHTSISAGKIFTQHFRTLIFVLYYKLNDRTPLQRTLHHSVNLSECRLCQCVIKLRGEMLHKWHSVAQLCYCSFVRQAPLIFNNSGGISYRFELPRLKGEENKNCFSPNNSEWSLSFIKSGEYVFMRWPQRRALAHRHTNVHGRYLQTDFYIQSNFFKTRSKKSFQHVNTIIPLLIN